MTTVHKAAEVLQSIINDLRASIKGNYDKWVELDTKLSKLVDIVGNLSANVTDLETRIRHIESNIPPIPDPAPAPPIPTPTPTKNVVVKPHITTSDFKDAVQVARKEGVDIEMRNGVYYNLVLDHTVLDNDINIICPSGFAVIDPDLEHNFVLNLAGDISNVCFTNIIFDGSSANYDAVKLHYTGDERKKVPHNIEFYNCHMRNAPAGNGILIVGYANNILLDDCWLYNNGNKALKDRWKYHGAYISASHVIIKKGGAYNNAGWGYSVYQSGGTAWNIGRLKDVIITETEAYNNGLSGRGYGILLSSGDELIANHNKVWNNEQGGIQVGFGAKDCQASYNTFYGRNSVSLEGTAVNTTQVWNNKYLPLKEAPVQ